MEHNSNGERGKIRGYLFEIVILQLLENNGFSLIKETQRGRVKIDRKNFVELKGRGTWHQIDCPMNCNFTIPFMYPIRLLGEVKFYSGQINKDKIREYIGVMKDIQENYFGLKNVTKLPQRFIEVGAYFSANGFSSEAELLAYAHGIKTLSYKNNHIINDIKTIIEELEMHHIDYDKISGDRFSEFMQRLRDFFSDSDIENSTYYNNLESFFVGDYKDLLKKLYEAIVEKIKSSFVGYSDTGFSFHFISEEEFPDEVFENTDTANCEIYFDEIGNIDNKKKSEYYFYIIFSKDNYSRRFYFTPPDILINAVKKSGKELLQKKEMVFNNVHVNIIIKNIKRNLTFKIDDAWMRRLYQRENSKKQIQ